MPIDDRPHTKMKHLSQDQRACIFFCFARGKKIKEIIPNFLRIFPDYGSGVDPKRLKKLLSDRLRKIRTHHEEEIEKLRAILIGFKPANIGFKPVDPTLHMEFLLFLCQELWWQTPSLWVMKIAKDPNGASYTIYKSLTKSCLGILKHARSASRKKAVSIIPIASAVYRLKCLQQLWDETPFMLLRKKVADVNGKIYETYLPNGRNHLKILAEARSEMEDLRFQGDASIVESVASIPMANPEHRLRCMQQLWDDTPLSLFKEVGTSGNNEPYEIKEINIKIHTGILQDSLLDREILIKTRGIRTEAELADIPFAGRVHRLRCSEKLLSLEDLIGG